MIETTDTVTIRTVRFSDPVLTAKERQDEIDRLENKNRGQGLWIPHTLYLPKDINHSQPTQIVSYFFVKYPADRFYNSQCCPGDDILGLSDDEDEHCSQQFWYSKDCETEEDYLKKKGTATAVNLPASELATAAELLLVLRKTTDTS